VKINYAARMPTNEDCDVIVDEAVFDQVFTPRIDTDIEDMTVEIVFRPTEAISTVP
jgi:hypothetical protein